MKTDRHNLWQLWPFLTEYLFYFIPFPFRFLCRWQLDVDLLCRIFDDDNLGRIEERLNSRHWAKSNIYLSENCHSCQRLRTSVALSVLKFCIQLNPTLSFFQHKIRFAFVTWLISCEIWENQIFDFTLKIFKTQALLFYGHDRHNTVGNFPENNPFRESERGKCYLRF